MTDLNRIIKSSCRNLDQQKPATELELVELIITMEEAMICKIGYEKS